MLDFLVEERAISQVLGSRMPRWRYSRFSEMHPGLKRSFQVMAGAEWLELLRKHIPDRYVQ